MESVNQIAARRNKKAELRKNESEVDKRRRLDLDSQIRRENRAKSKAAESESERVARLKKKAETKAASRAARALSEGNIARKERLAEEAKKRSDLRSKIPPIYKDHLKNSYVNLRLSAALHSPFRGNMFFFNVMKFLILTLLH